MDFWTIYALVALAVFFTVFGWYTDPDGKRDRLTLSWFAAALIVSAAWPIFLAAAALWARWAARNTLDPIPRITDWLIRRAQRHPYSPIHKPQGRYMDRGWVFNPDWRLSKKRWRKWLPAARIHHTQLSDLDRDMHDHPWPNVSVVLRGYYYEIVPKDQKQDPTLDREGRNCIQYARRPLSVVFRKAEDRHRLVVPDRENGVWSLFIMLPWKRDWGYHTPEGWVYWRDYLSTTKELDHD